MRKLILVVLIAISFSTKAQVKDSVVYVSDTVKVYSVNDLNDFIKFYYGRVPQDKYEDIRAIFITFIQMNDDKRKLKNKKH